MTEENKEPKAAVGATEAVRNDNDILESPDPMAWAEKFVAIRQDYKERTGLDLAEDPAIMVGWFASAFQRGEWNSPHYKEYIEELFKELGIDSPG